MKKSIMILDANAFIHSRNLREYNLKYELITTGDILCEIRDKKAQEKFQQLNLDLKIKDPSEKSVNEVKAFSIQTGDYSSLSYQDSNLIALAVDLQKENGLAIKKAPAKIKDFKLKQTVVEDYSDEKETESDEDGWKVSKKQIKEVENKKKKKTQENNIYNLDIDNYVKDCNKQSKFLLDDEKQTEVKEEKEEVESSMSSEFEQLIEETQNLSLQSIENTSVISQDEFSDDGEGWINQENLNKKIKHQVKLPKQESFNVYVMTTDFAIQNVVLQLGIKLVSFDGLQVKKLRRFVQECGCCFHITPDSTLEWCPACKNHALTKISCQLKSNGELVLFRSKHVFTNNRGKIYPIPKYIGGHKGKDIILREDELNIGGKKYQNKKTEKKKDKKFDRNMLDFDNGLGFDCIKHKQQLNNNVVFGYGKKNPNEAKKKRK